MDMSAGFVFDSFIHLPYAPNTCVDHDSFLKKKKKGGFGFTCCFLSVDKKEFDAFVSYANWSSPETEATGSLSEEHLALNLFPEVLENTYGYSLCLFERDVTPGGGRSCLPRNQLEHKESPTVDLSFFCHTFILIHVFCVFILL